MLKSGITRRSGPLRAEAPGTEGTQIQDLGFSKDFLEIGAEASGGEDEGGDDPKLKTLLREYENVDFGKLATINFSTGPTLISIAPSPPPRALPQTADFLFNSQESGGYPANNYQLNLKASSLSSQASPKVPDPLNTSNAWAKNFGSQSQGSKDNSFARPKVAKKDVIDSEGFLDF
jgi:hypothetical protein